MRIYYTSASVPNATLIVDEVEPTEDPIGALMGKVTVSRKLPAKKVVKKPTRLGQLTQKQYQMLHLKIPKSSQSALLRLNSRTPEQFVLRLGGRTLIYQSPPWHCLLCRVVQKERLEEHHAFQRMILAERKDPTRVEAWVHPDQRPKPPPFKLPKILRTRRHIQIRVTAELEALTRALKQIVRRAAVYREGERLLVEPVVIKGVPAYWTGTEGGCVFYDVSLVKPDTNREHIGGSRNPYYYPTFSWESILSGEWPPPNDEDEEEMEA